MYKDLCINYRLIRLILIFGVSCVWGCLLFQIILRTVVESPRHCSLLILLLDRLVWYFDNFADAGRVACPAIVLHPCLFLLRDSELWSCQVAPSYLG